MQVPKFSDYQGNVDYRQFQADLDHYITQLTLDNSIRRKRDSVAILPNSKDKIRSYVSGLRQCIEKAHMTDAKRDALLNKLDEFETELEKRRLNILAVARLTFELLAIPGGLWASAEVANKLIHNMMQTVAEAKSIEQETSQLPSMGPPKALSPPRAEPISKRGGGRMNEIIDDDIPF
jgi:vacuolar-type H+-ATPase subunit I/STV1